MKAKNSLLFAGNWSERTTRILHNIGGLFLLKGMSVGIRLLLVPMTLNYLEPVKFGLWMAISSIIEMMILFEFGLGNGLRNKLTQSLSAKDLDGGRAYVSTTYALSTAIMVPLIGIFLLLNEYINWAGILNAQQSMAEELNQLVFWMLLFYGLKLVSGIIIPVTKANHWPVIGAFIELVSDLVALLVIYFLIKYTDNSLVYLGGAKFFILAIIPLMASFVLFFTKFKNQAPSIKLVDFKKVDDLLKLSWKFFLIQLSSVIIFSTDNIIISRLFGPESVTPYSIVFQYFNLVTVFFAIVSAPLWSAYTEAYTKDDHAWIAKTLKKMMGLWMIVILVVIGMAIFAGNIITLWIGRDLGLESMLIAFMGLYVIVQAWNRVFNWLLSGIGSLNCTLYSMLFGALINIPLSVFLARNIGLGVSGVILGSILSLGVFSLFCPFRVKYLVKYI